MESLTVSEFSEIIREDNQYVAGEFFEMLRELTTIDDAIQVSSRLVNPDSVNWGWGFWW